MGTVGFILAPLGDLLDPATVNANEEWDLYKMREIDPQIERIDQLIEELEASINPKLEKLHIDKADLAACMAR